MTQGNPYKEKRRFRIGFILLIGLAAFSGAQKDFNQFASMVADVHHFADQWLGVVLPTVQARSGKEFCSAPAVTNAVMAEDDFRWTGRVSPGKAVEIKGISGDISAEPASGDEIEVLANKTSRKSDQDSVKIQYVEHAGGVTVCALYPSEDSSQVITCEPGKGNGHSSATIGVR